MRSLLILLGLALPGVALARQPALHDIAWYSAHDQERSVTLRMCHNNQTLQLASDDCANAERAQATATFKGTNRDPLAFMDNPAYFTANPISRQGILNICEHPERPGAEPFLRYCAPARASAGMGR